MATSPSKTCPQKSNRSQVNYNYDYDFDYDSCTKGMSSYDEEEIDYIFLNEYLNIDDIDNGSDDLQNDMNVEG